MTPTKPADEPAPATTDTGIEPQTTTPAEEWGERLDTGRQIARGGDDVGCVRGAVGDDVHDPRSGGGHCNTAGLGQP
jgi:hypothetical protein